MTHKEKFPEPKPYTIIEFDGKRAVMDFERCSGSGPIIFETSNVYFRPRIIWEESIGEDAVGNEGWQPSSPPIRYSASPPIRYSDREQNLHVWEEISRVASAIVEALRKENKKHLNK